MGIKTYKDVFYFRSDDKLRINPARGCAKNIWRAVIAWQIGLSPKQTLEPKDEQLAALKRPALACGFSKDALRPPVALAHPELIY